MVTREEKIRQIIEFVKEHPQSFASRTVIRRLIGTDYEFNDELFHKLEEIFSGSRFDEYELDCCYDLIK
ncbi:hypothetical protein BBF96_09080 [Anoxybacter fermentans]|uniref:Uncharacterized protein n=1 Tax=Anoxybacter fermentans TaxID=1323375 RepID=A0A3Q9HSK6_9FIRM|nr:hypothetical protein [Anoxybacter fermentans]AZR73524.1 hypothetical protein BBF96_09080 [Anoxybacter fermentans]